MRTAPRIDVLVVGLGPAGGRAAERAAAAGLTVVAVERKRHIGAPVQCAEFVPALMSQEIPGLGEVTRQGIAAMTTHVDDVEDDHAPDFPGRMIDRDRLDTALARRAEARGARLLPGARVVDIRRDGTVALSDGRRLAPRVLIGCDGPRSRVGAAIGQRNRELVATRQVTVPLTVPHAATDIYLGARYPGGYGWLFPKGAVANLGAGVERARAGDLARAVTRLHAAEVARGRVGAPVLGLTGGDIPVGGPLHPHGRLGGVLVLLAGDAAGLTHPITGAGIPAAVISGSLAGEAAAAWLDGDSSAAVDYADELEALFGTALRRALTRRRAIAAAGPCPSPAALRRAWIAYPEYWAA
ncbi:MAG: geranylgeranyl reductase family protein [Ectothiorhodospiraceae bacterium]|nr:geranylgeranyl reductase family protein [Ectothiorhodospiraceae bacterium]